MRILFLNQYFPPDPAPTGILLAELAEALQSDGHEVQFIAARQDYRSGQQRAGRFVREALALGRMLLDSLRARKADLVISATSPPCLLVVATLTSAFHRARSVHWVMDLYPEIAVALGEVRPGLLTRAIERVMGWCYRRTDRVIVLDADMGERLRRYGVNASEIRPWVFASLLKYFDQARDEREVRWTWIYSGNLGRAHEWETLLQTQLLLEQRMTGIRLLFQGGGPSWPAARARADELKLKHCEWRDYVDEAELPASLLRCQALAVTQFPGAKGLLWPSKLGLIMALPRPILWIGPKDGAIANELRMLPHAGIFGAREEEQIADWLQTLQTQPPNIPTAATFDPRRQRTAALETWREIVSGLR